MENIARVIRLKRTEKNLSPLHLANMLDIDIEDVLKWEEGTLKPNVEMLKRLALIFNMSLEAFYTNEIEEVIEEPQIIEEITHKCLWCDQNFYEHEISFITPYVICKSCEEKKKNKKNELMVLVSNEKTKFTRLTKKYTKATLWINYLLVILTFLLLFPILNRFNEERLYVFLGGLYFSISIVSFITLLHFERVTYKLSKKITKLSFNLPKKLFDSKIKGIIWSLIIKLIFGSILIVIACVSIIILNLVIILISPFIYPFTLINYRRSAKYDNL